MSGTLQADFLQPQSNAGLSILNPSGNTVMASINSAGIFSSTGSLLVANTGNVFSTGNVTASGTITSNTLTSNTLVLTGSTSGSVSLVAPAIAGSNTATLPAATGTVMVSGNMPAFSGGMSTSVTISTSNVWTKMPCDYKYFDTANCFDITTNKGRFTPTVAGYYQLNASVGPNNSVSRVGIAIYKNGSSYQYGTDSSTATGVNAVSMSATIYLNGSTDYVEIYAAMGNCPQPWSYNATAQFSWFNGFLARAA